MQSGINFQFSEIEIETFQIQQDAPPEDPEVNLSVDFDFGIATGKRMVGTLCKLTISTKEGGSILSLHVSCGFSIKEEDWNTRINMEKSWLELPLDFMQHLAALSYSTARGVLHAKTEGTEFNRYLLPLINIQEAVPEAYPLPVLD